jgi:plasmid stability protein
MKTTVDLPDGLVKAVKLRAVHDGRKLKDTVAELLRTGLAHPAVGSATTVRADAAMMKRRRELVGKFVSGEWGVELAGYEESRQADRTSAKKRAQAWRD